MVDGLGIIVIAWVGGGLNAEASSDGNPGLMMYSETIIETMRTINV